ncbi:DUF2484 family protein [Roseicyclus salinarum]|uniref:DUF2484 family protein n=1 Tax=Roseicyclus salinarum TaxID=3036773 RepID=UPI003241F8D0
MPLSFILACLWALSACFAGMAPQRYHWPAAWVLIATGIPLLGYVTWQMGPVWGLICFAAGASVLRWPLMRAAERMRRIVVHVERSEAAEAAYAGPHDHAAVEVSHDEPRRSFPKA